MPIRFKSLLPRAAAAAMTLGALAVVCAANLHTFGLSAHSVGGSATAINAAARTTVVGVARSAEYMIDISTLTKPMAV